MTAEKVKGIAAIPLRKRFSIKETGRNIICGFKNFRKNWGQLLIHLAIFILLVMVFFPVLILISKSFKSIQQDMASPFALTFPLLWENYGAAWQYIQYYFLNTFIIAGASTLGVLAVNSITAFAFTRFNFRFKNQLFIAMLALMMMPGMLTLVPMYMLLDNLKLVGNKLGLILPAIAGGIPFGVFLLKTFFQGVPRDLFEAAEIDGAGNFRQFLIIMIPLSKPILFTMGINTLLGSWNDYLWPMLILSADESQYTIAVGLYGLAENFYKISGSYGPAYAGYVLSSLPLIVVFMFASKQFIQGLTSGAFKM